MMTSRAPGGKIRVLVAHPGTQHSYQTALALQRAGFLETYVAGFYYKKTPALDWLIQRLPGGLGKRLERELLRRRKDELDSGRILTFPLAELLYVMCARLALTRKWSGAVLHWRNRRFDRRVARLVRESKPDLVICYDSCALNTFGACRDTGSVAVLDQTACLPSHGADILREEAGLHGEAIDALNVPEWLVEQCRREALAADRILVASDLVRDGLVANGVPPERIALLRYGVDVARFHPPAGRKEGPYRVLYVGHLSRSKGVRYLLQAFSDLALDNAELLMVGTVTDAEDILERYRGVFRHVSQVPNREIQSWFQTADIFVFPSLLEGMGLVVLEAMATGLPVITTENAACVVRDGIDGYVVPIRDVEALKDRMRMLYLDHGLRERMGREARLRAESFTWDAYSHELCGLMEAWVMGESS
jgi:glycosyltransferase involved in cell wall biosynthesis